MFVVYNVDGWLCVCVFFFWCLANGVTYRKHENRRWKKKKRKKKKTEIGNWVLWALFFTSLEIVIFDGVFFWGEGVGVNSLVSIVSWNKSYHPNEGKKRWSTMKIGSNQPKNWEAWCKILGIEPPVFFRTPSWMKHSFHCRIRMICFIHTIFVGETRTQLNKGTANQKIAKS